MQSKPTEARSPCLMAALAEVTANGGRLLSLTEEVCSPHRTQEREVINSLLGKFVGHLNTRILQFFADIFPAVIRILKTVALVPD